jgi:hypothetical protein
LHPQGLLFSHNKSAIRIGDVHNLGCSGPGIPSGQSSYVNQLIGMALGTIDIANRQIRFRSINAFSPMPAACRRTAEVNYKFGRRLTYASVR